MRFGAPCGGEEDYLDSSSSEDDYLASPLRTRSRNGPRKVHPARRRNVYGLDSSDDEIELGSGLESEEDSEEEAWPVKPVYTRSTPPTTRPILKRPSSSHAAPSPGRASPSRASPSPDPELIRSVRASSCLDEWERWNQRSQQAAWQSATLRFQVTATAYHTRAGDYLSPSEKARRAAAQKEMDEVRLLLEKLDVQKQEEAQREKDGFERRNKILWDSIEKSILAAEKQAQEAAAAELAAANRVRQEAAEREAKAMREAAQKEEAQKAEAQRQAQEKQKKAREEQEARDKERMEEGGLKGAGKEYEWWQAKMKEIKDNVLPAVSTNPDWRKQCYALKRQITPKIGQLTNSRSEIARITTAIGDILSLARSLGPTAPPYIWLLNHLSKCLIRQAEAEVVAKQETAYPLGRLVLGLIMGGHETLGDVLMARLVKKCPWVVPFYPKQREGESQADYRKRLGHTAGDETSVQHNERMAGILSLYFAILQTPPLPASLPIPPTSPPGAVTPAMRLPAGWTWLSHALRPPMPNFEPVPLFVATFLDIAGERWRAVYGRQAEKVLVALRDATNSGAAGWQKGTESSVTRIKILLEGWEAGRGLGKGEGRELDT